MGNKVKRPISVWIAQIILVIFVLMLLFVFLLASLISSQNGSISFSGTLVMAIIDLVIVTMLVAAFWGMANRKSYGRWLGVGMLSLIVIFAIVGDVLFPPNSAKPMASKLIEILLSIFVFVVTLHIALSDKVATFFARKVDLPPLDNPPPPPSFDT